MTKPDFAVFTPEGVAPDEGAIKQMITCMAAGDASGGSLSADHHLGYSMPIGASIAYPDYVSPSGVGFDIGCGNKAVGTSLLYSDISGDLDRIMDEVSRRISFGMGRPNNEPVDHPVLDKIMQDAPSQNVRNLAGLAVRQLGTVGGGNHYVDLFREEGTDRVWIGVHFGSRGFGHKIATGFLNLAAGRNFDEHPPNESMYAPPTLLRTDSALGHYYIEAMTLAGEYAYAGRDTAVAKVLEILGNPSVTHEVHNHHNFAWLENHGGQDVWVVRKGATPLFPGQQGFVGASMGENAVIIEGQGTRAEQGSVSGAAHKDAHIAGDAALWSAPHGAGRAMSRTEAKGKSRKRSQCLECGHTQARYEDAFTVCPECHLPGVRKVWVQETEGKVDWKAAQRDLKRKGIVLRGAEADEAPGAYKRLPAVLEAHSAYVKVVHQLRPIGVAMAGPGIVDPFKD
jgi:tRNA-splicing ligase RtcB